MKRSFILILGSTVLLTSLLTGLLTALAAQAESSLSIANRFNKCGFYDQAYDAALHAVKSQPKSPDAHWALAEALKGTNFTMRAVRECEIYLALAPNGPNAASARSTIAGWKKSIANSGDKSYSNLDCFFRDYYKTHTYQSWDVNPYPRWPEVSGKGKLAVDVHFVAPYLTDPKDRTQLFDKWCTDLLTQFHDRWEKQVTNSGEAQLFFHIDKERRLQPTIVSLKGGDKFENELLAVIHSFDGSPILDAPARQGRVVIKLMVDARPASNLGSWYAFTGESEGSRSHGELSGAIISHGKTITGANQALRSVEPTKVVALADYPLPSAEPPRTSEQISKDDLVMAKAQAAYSSDKFVEARDLLWPLAERDVRGACLLLGKAYGRRDNRAAVVWFEKAAAMGDPEALYEMGRIQEWGDGAASGGIDDAVEWYTRGAELGSADCWFRLGVLSEFGEGVPKDLKKAAECYSKAEQNPDAKKGLMRVSG